MVRLVPAQVLDLYHDVAYPPADHEAEVPYLVRSQDELRVVALDALPRRSYARAVHPRVAHRDVCDLDEHSALQQFDPAVPDAADESLHLLRVVHCHQLPVVGDLRHEEDDSYCCDRLHGEDDLRRGHRQNVQVERHARFELRAHRDHYADHVIHGRIASL